MHDQGDVWAESVIQPKQALACSFTYSRLSKMMTHSYGRTVSPVKDVTYQRAPLVCWIVSTFVLASMTDVCNFPEPRWITPKSPKMAINYLDPDAIYDGHDIN